MPRIIFSHTEAEKALWVEAAHAERISLAEWLRRAANERARAPVAGAEVTHATGTVDASSSGGGPARAGARMVPEHRADPKDKASQEHAPKERRRGSSGMCEHRVPTGTFCKRCDA